jgi:hypothetical protein
VKNGETRVKKYRGGQNIRMERARRFKTDHSSNYPGPG